MTIDYGQSNLKFSCALVDQLAASGLRHAVICPGSRSTPIAVALAAHPKIRPWVLIDERSAAFFALGMARRLGDPVALLSTSGTAAANFLPAVVEANLSRIPLLVFTADRPPELRDWGAAQTINQTHVYGRHAKWFAELPVPDGDPDLPRRARATAMRALQSSRSAPPGPVHLNLPFREPLLPTATDLRTMMDEYFACGRRSRVELGTHQTSTRLHGEDIVAVADTLSREPRGLIVCGPESRPGDALGAIVSELSAATGYPILADPLSGVRFGSHSRTNLIDTYDSFLRHQDLHPELRPDIVIQTGAIPTSKPLQRFLAASPGRHHLLIDPGSPRDPFHLATDHLQAEPVDVLPCVTQAILARGACPDANWIERWAGMDAVASTTLAAALGENGELFEGRAVAEVVRTLPSRATLVVGNSMPVRDLDTFVRGDLRNLRIVSNRGANGIDGVVSSALGAAAVNDNPVVLIIGDLSFYHDLNGLLAANRFGLKATIVVLNNNGGGIFSFLPQAEQLDRETFESLFGTPIDLDIAAAARLYRATYTRPADWAAFQCALRAASARDGLTIIELRTDRERNLALHREVSARATAAIGDLTGRTS